MFCGHSLQTIRPTLSGCLLQVRHISHGHRLHAFRSSIRDVCLYVVYLKLFIIQLWHQNRSQCTNTS
jgi:hypothetical protein